VERHFRARRKQRKPVPPKGLPFALVEGGTKGLRLVAVNGAARQFGLTRGQRLADARAAMPDLITEQHESDKDTTSLLGLCHWMERYSPWVAPDGKDGVLIDSTGVAHLFGGEGPMQADIEKRLGGYGYTARIAFAPTIGAAWALARYGTPGETNLHTLPVESLRIDTAATHTLRRLGLKTVGSLVTLPRASLARRFRGETIHENVLLRLDEMFGQRAEPLNALNPPSSFIAHRAMMEPVIHHEGLLTVLQGLTHALVRDLQQHGQGALRLILKLFRSDGTRAQIPAGLSAPSHDALHLFRLLQPKLDMLDAGFGIDAMTLEARETGTVVTQQYGFAEDTSGKNLLELNDRVMNRQERSINQLKAVASHVPERAEVHVGASEEICHAPTKTDRPLMIFDTPEPARVIAAVPDGPPMRMTWRRITRRIIKSRGPERIAPEWWKLQGNERPRDYYVIEDTEGRRYWIYRDGLYGEDETPAPKWFVHGLTA
jgi:protein ImuB